MLARRDLTTAQLNLALILGLAQRREPWNIAGIEPEDRQIPHSDEIVELAKRQRFDLLASAAQVEAAEQQLEMELLQVYPSLEIGLNAERTERRALPGRKVLADTARTSVAAGELTAPSIESKGQRDLARRQLIDSMIGPGIQLTLPIWDQNQAQIAKAHFEVVRARKQRQELTDLATTEVRLAAIEAQTAMESFRLYESQTLPQVDDNLQSARSLYENGAESVVILLEAQEESFLQKREAAGVLHELLIAVAKLEEAAGGKLPTPNTDHAGDRHESDDSSEEVNGGPQ